MTNREDDIHLDFAQILMEEIQREVDAEIIGGMNGQRSAPLLPALPDPGVLGIISEGKGNYRVRGHGTEAERFETHLKGLAVCTGMDWPWYYLTLNEGVMHEQLLSGFEQHYLGEDND